MKKVMVDWELCEANAACMRIAPEVFRVDEQDQLHLLSENVAPELLAKVERAVRACPRRALSLAESP